MLNSNRPCPWAIGPHAGLSCESSSWEPHRLCMRARDLWESIRLKAQGVVGGCSVRQLLPAHTSRSMDKWKKLMRVLSQYHGEVPLREDINQLVTAETRVTKQFREAP